ncbi:MAG: hypothetical protein OEV81_11040 [Betaproteobacteria bacterium]|nr:hypothetical protein [Betaproteobacteria bacterium]MDH5221785.1 hypothetical protein [Betaproteobacteria bacterium]MDH5351488.1 hypothetical protein [Betaproteobacteria bacterium]
MTPFQSHAWIAYVAEHERPGTHDIVDVPGRGAMGLVFKGFCPGFDRTVAI